MSLSDPIGDMIARVKNAQARNHKKVELPSSNFKTKIADILKNEGFIKDFKAALEKLRPYYATMGKPWTAGAPLPGGDFPVDGVNALITDLRSDHPFLTEAWATRTDNGPLATSLARAVS